MNKELLEKVINDRLKISLSQEVSEEERKQALKDAMEATDRHIQIEKMESSRKEDKKNKILKCVEIGVPVALFALDCTFKIIYMKKVCNFEKDYTFTTTPGKGIGSLFRFK